MQLFTNKNVHFYSEIPDFISRIRFIGLFFILGWPLSELLFAQVYDFYQAFWWPVLLFTGVNILFQIVINKRMLTKKQMAYWVSVLGVFATVFLMYRCIQNESSTIILMEIGAAIIFISFLFDRLYFSLIYLVPVTVFYITTLFFLDFQLENSVAYLIGIALLLAFFMITYLFKVFRLSLLEFSENVLSSYDKIVVVFNENADLIYMNDYGLKRFGLKKGEFKFQDWWDFRGYSDGDVKKYKGLIKAEIIRNRAMELKEQKIVLQSGEEMLVEWSDQIVHGRFFVGIGTDVTTERKSQVESEKLSKVSIALGAGVIITNQDGEISWCNTSFCEIFEFDKDELIGKRPSEVFEVPDFFKEQYKTIVINQLKVGGSVEVPHYTKSKRLIWVLLNRSRIKNEFGDTNEFIEVVTDITLQKNKELQFKQTSLIAERTQTPVMICDNDLVINWFNSALLKEFNTEFNNIIGENFLSFCTERWTRKEDILDLKAGIKEVYSVQMDMLLRKEELPQWYKISMDPILDDYGNLSQFMIVMQNIQKLKDAQHIIELKNEDMVSSISYAKRIQSAFLPSAQMLKENMPPHFFFYRPKDIVSGDFYYAKRRDNLLFIVVADCTGHGVPGAMITSIGASALNNAIIDYKLEKPNEILEHADFYLKNALSTEEEDLTDGMDLGIVVIDFKTKELTFSGARRPLVYFDHTTGEQIVIDSQKRSIGELDEAAELEFELFRLKLDRKFSFFLFTDGIPDQFGGERHKRIGKKRVLKLIEGYSKFEIDEVKHLFDSFFIDWTQDYKVEQTDDMLFFGMSIDAEYLDKNYALLTTNANENG